jgi:DNA-directed RNA polymerase subunit E'/Rpb7
MVFVSNHLIPDQYQFDHSANPPAYSCESIDSGDNIERGTAVRIRIIGVNVKQTEIVVLVYF